MINPLEFYFFENFSGVVLNFSNPNRDSKLLDLEFDLFTDLGNYWKRKFKLEIPYNSRVNVSFVFDNVKNASLVLSFEYLGNNYSIGFDNVNCRNSSSINLYSSTSIVFNNGCINIGLKPVCFNYSISNLNNNLCDINISFFNLPTYTNYSINWSYYDDSSCKNGTTWRIFTPYILACNSSSSGLSCDNRYWKRNVNTFYLLNNKINTRISTSQKKVGLGSSTTDIHKFSYCWNGSVIKVWKCFLENDNSYPYCNSYKCQDY